MPKFAALLGSKVSSKNARAIRMPPPITKGSMWDTPFIRCLYTWRPALSFTGAAAAAGPPSLRYTGTAPLSICLISSAGL